MPRVWRISGNSVMGLCTRHGNKLAWKVQVKICGAIAKLS